MNGLSGPDSDEYDPYKGMKSHEIQKDAANQDSTSKIKPRSSASLLRILYLIKKFVHLFQGYSKKDQNIYKKALLDDFLQLQSSLNLLKQENLSQDLQFLKNLSQQWNQVLRGIEKLKLEEALYRQLRNFVLIIEQYPKNKDFSLGYYLNEAAGEDWIPFPWIEILTDLYQEHKSNPKKSHLNHWDQALEQLINLLSS